MSGLHIEGDNLQVGMCTYCHILKDEFLKGLVYIDAIVVDTAALSMHACKLSCIHGVGAWWDDRNSVRIEGFHPRTQRQPHIQPGTL
jgi:hypothetical protein